MVFRELGREIPHRDRRLLARRCCLGHCLTSSFRGLGKPRLTLVE
jgi:hypothetical protein